jgi:hypothetical protein
MFLKESIKIYILSALKIPILLHPTFGWILYFNELTTKVLSHMMKFVRYGTTGPSITSSLIPLMNGLYLDRIA